LIESRASLPVGGNKVRGRSRLSCILIPTYQTFFLSGPSPFSERKVGKGITKGQIPERRELGERRTTIKRRA
jgi:hypothetical protein